MTGEDRIQFMNSKCQVDFYKKAPMQLFAAPYKLCYGKKCCEDEEQLFVLSFVHSNKHNKILKHLFSRYPSYVQHHILLFKLL